MYGRSMRTAGASMHSLNDTYADTLRKCRPRILIYTGANYGMRVHPSVCRSYTEYGGTARARNRHRAGHDRRVTSRAVDGSIYALYALTIYPELYNIPPGFIEIGTQVPMCQS